MKIRWIYCLAVFLILFCELSYIGAGQTNLLASGLDIKKDTENIHSSPDHLISSLPLTYLPLVFRDYRVGMIQEITTSTGLPKVILLSRNNIDGQSLVEISLDGGRSWKLVGSGPWSSTPIKQFHIALVPKTDQTVRILVAVTAPGNTGVYRTGDLGASWAIVDLGLPPPYSFQDFILGEIVTSPADPTRIYLAGSTPVSYGGPGSEPVWYGLSSQSMDSGITWVTAEPTYDRSVSMITPSPVVADKTYCYLSGPSYFGLSPTWSPHNFPVGQISLDAKEPQWVYGINGTSGRSYDDGINWIPWVNHPSDNGQLVAHPTKSQVLFLLSYPSSNPGLFRSVNGGGDWQKLSSSFEGFIAPDYGIPGRLFWVRGEDLFVSCDDGSQWYPINSGCTP